MDFGVRVNQLREGFSCAEACTSFPFFVPLAQSAMMVVGELEGGLTFHKAQVRFDFPDDMIQLGQTEKDPIVAGGKFVNDTFISPTGVLDSLVEARNRLFDGCTPVAQVLNS